MFPTCVVYRLRELAREKDENGVGIYMCVRCYEYFGRDEELMLERYWNPISQDGPCLGVGSCAYHVYAVQECKSGSSYIVSYN